MSPVEPGVLAPVRFAARGPDGLDTGLQRTSLFLLPRLPQEHGQMLQASDTVRMGWPQCLPTNLQRLMLERQHLSLCVLRSARKALGAGWACRWPAPVHAHVVWVVAFRASAFSTNNSSRAVRQK